MKKRFLSKLVLGLCMFSVSTFFMAQTAEAAVYKTYGYIFSGLDSWTLMSIKDTDANGNMSNVPAIIQPGGRGYFSANYNGNTATVSGNFENYTPYWRVTAPEKTGYTFKGITENTPRGNFAMYSYPVGGNPYVLDVDAGIWYGRWMDRTDAENNAHYLRQDGSWSTIYASYEPNQYWYTANGALLTKVTFDSAIPNVPVPTNSNTVYFKAGTNHKGQAANCSTTELTATHTFNGYYCNGTQHFNKYGQSVPSKYTWAHDIDLAENWTYNPITLPTPSLTGYRFDGWYCDGKLVGYGGSGYVPTSNVTMYAKWTDVTAPTVDISATPTTWKNEDGVVKIRAVDNESGIASVQLYRKTATSNYQLVETWKENNGVYKNNYTYTDTGEDQFQYRVIVKDRTGNKTIKDSNIIYIDRTAPVATDTIIHSLGEYDAPVVRLRNADGTINSEAYGLYVSVSANDTKEKRTVSKIKNAYVKVYQKNNPSNVKYYDINEGAGVDLDNEEEQTSTIHTVPSVSTGKKVIVLTPTSLDNITAMNQTTFEKDIVIDVTKDFNGVLDLAYEVHIIDNAGNDSYDKYNNLRGENDREARLYATIKRLTLDDELENESAFRGGYKGVLTITTTGWVDQVDVKWPEEIYIGRAEDEKLNQVTMNYNALVHMAPESDPTIDMNGVFLSDKNRVTSPDTNNTTFTRVYQFYFWIPFYMERANNIQESTPYVVDLTAIRPYAYPQKNDGVAKLSVPFTIGDGNIFKRIRSSILY